MAMSKERVGVVAQAACPHLSALRLHCDTSAWLCKVDPTFKCKRCPVCLSLLLWHLQVAIPNRRISLERMEVTAGSSGEGALAREEKGRLRTCVCTYPTDRLKVGLTLSDG